MYSPRQSLIEKFCTDSLERPGPGDDNGTETTAAPKKRKVNSPLPPFPKKLKKYKVPIVDLLAERAKTLRSNQARLRRKYLLKARELKLMKKKY